MRAKHTLTREVVEHIQEYLGDCSQKVICRYLGVSNVALSQNIEKQFIDILENKVGSRLDALLYVLECAKKDETLEHSALHRLLTMPAYVQKDGWKLDVVSAIHENCPKEVLVEIFFKAVELARKKVDKAPLRHGLYNVIHAQA